jgi:Mycothiol-dependent nitroreductase Rv2466c
VSDVPTAVDFWFDPRCPFTWRTSRWLVDVANRRPVSITWRLMSLAMLNEGKDVPEQYLVRMRQGTLALRVLAACGDTEGQDAMAKLYTCLGSRRHERGEPYGGGVIRAALSEAGLPGSLAAAAEDAGYDDAVRSSHQAGQRRVGTESGSPVLAVDGGRGYFGPVVVPIPTGEDGIRLFEAVRMLSSVPAFSELKTARAPLEPSP